MGILAVIFILYVIWDSVTKDSRDKKDHIKQKEREKELGLSDEYYKFVNGGKV